MASKPGFSGVLIVLTLTVLVLITVTIQYSYDIALGKKDYRRDMHYQAIELVDTFNHKMMMFYQGLRIIARMPDVRRIGSKDESLDEQSIWVLQELYSNLHANIDVSEVYIIPLDFDPDKIDIRTGKLFEPLIFLDNEIIGEEVEGEESYEYRQIVQQLQWMKKNVPTDKNFSELAYPAIFGKEVITCDDRYYVSESGDYHDKDRSGVIYSVPFYSKEGELKGLVAGIILTRTLNGMLSNENFVIRNSAMGYSIEPTKAGAWQNSDQWVKQGQPDPDLIYSEVLQLQITDNMGDWVLWAGAPNEKFWDLPEIEVQQQFTIGAYLMVILVSAAVISNLRKQKLIAEKNLALGKEIEDRQKAQRSTEKHSARLDAIFTSVIDGIISSDGKGVIDKCNPAIESLFGYEEGELIGKKINILMTESDSLHHDKYISGFNEKKSSQVVGMQGRRLVGLRKDGSTFPIEVTVNSAKTGGRNFFVGVMRDLTERERSEKELFEARDVALESSRLKSELLANVSHELRTPMNGIMGCTDLLKETDLDEEQASYLKILSDSSSSLVTIMDDLMDFSRLDADKLVLDVGGFGLRESVESAVHLLADRASEKGLDLKLEYGDDLSEILYGDTNRLRQILTNLIGNAIKFTGEGGVTVTVSMVHSDDKNQNVRFEISDTGIGISEEHHSQIFDSFVQADGSITREHGGMGLGLAICTRLVHAMSGEIGLNSKLGEGTTFWFMVSFKKEDPRKSAA